MWIAQLPPRNESAVLGMMEPCLETIEHRGVDEPYNITLTFKEYSDVSVTTKMKNQTLFMYNLRFFLFFFYMII